MVAGNSNDTRLRVSAIANPQAGIENGSGKS